MDNNLPANKRIAMFSIHSDPLAPLGSQEAGGQNIYIYSLMKELDKKGWSIDVYTRWDEPHEKSVSLLGKKSRVIRLKGGPVKYVPKNELLNHLPELYENFLNAIDHQNPYALFHGHYWDGGWMALKAHKQFNVPLIENFHSLGQIRFETKKQHQVDGDEADFFKKRIKLEKDIIKEAACIISLSQTEESDLKEFYATPPGKIAVIPGGVNLKQFSPVEKAKARQITNLPQNDFILLYIGRLEWRKGIGTLINAVNLLKEDIPNIQLAVVGGKIYGKQKNLKDVQEYGRLLQKIEEQGIKDKIKFTGRIDHGRLPSFYSSADIFIIPSYYEPFGLVALEAMASSVPVIASNVGGLKTIIKDGENGLLFEPCNPLDLKEKILAFYNSRETADKMAQNGYNTVIKEYFWKNIAEKIQNVYQKILS